MSYHANWPNRIPLPPAFSGGARRHLPLLLLLFAGSGCSALIYEIVWYQLLQLVIGSTAVSLGVLLATFMGGLCLGSLLLPRLKLRRAASAARVRQARTGHRRLRDSGAVRDAAGRFGVHVRGGARDAGDPAARAGERTLPAAAHVPDGRVAARGVALDRGVAGRRRHARDALRREHRGRGVRLPAGGLLPAARVRHGDGHVRGGGHQCGGGAGEFLAGQAGAGAHSRPTMPSRRLRPERGRST